VVSIVVTLVLPHVIDLSLAAVSAGDDLLTGRFSPAANAMR